MCRDDTSNDRDYHQSEFDLERLVDNIVSLLDVHSICVAVKEPRFRTRHTTVISVQVYLF